MRLLPKLSVDILCISELSVSHPFGRITNRTPRRGELWF